MLPIKKLFLVSISILFFNVHAQEKVNPLADSQKNSIWFVDITGGGAFGRYGGFMASGSVNYQYKKHLFTFRNTINSVLDKDFFIIPVFTRKIRENNQYALLYGRRHIEDDFSFSYSAGISYSTYKEILANDAYNTNNSLGLPLQFGIKWFKSKKSRFRIYELIPVGKPSALGNSIGFKFLANISENPYVGIGLTIGLGKHKIYD